jgi:hypothetical protein
MRQILGQSVAFSHGNHVQHVDNLREPEAVLAAIQRMEWMISR